MTWKERVNNALRCGGFLQAEINMAFDHYKGPAMEKLTRLSGGEGKQTTADLSRLSQDAFNMTCKFASAVFNNNPEKANIILKKLNRMHNVKFLRKADEESSNV